MKNKSPFFIGKHIDYNGDAKSRLSQICEEEEEKKTDSELMPPPPPPCSEDSAAAESANSAKPNTPLAAMLPPKYANVDVKEFFPDFRQDSVLRFSRLFGPGKQAHLPKIWKHVKKKKKKKLNHQKSHDNQLNNINDNFEEKLNSGGIETKNEQSFRYLEEPPTLGFDLNFAPNPHPSECISDDESVLCKPADVENNANAVKGEGEKSKGNKDGPKEADWRFGPAQLWYDMLGVPATGDGFDYGFKVILKDIKPAFNELRSNGSSPPDEGYYDGDNEEEKEFPDDAFHMLTQYNWEEDIIWNGDDTKHKLNQKRKNMAAGWVPSSYNRTAQAFSPAWKIIYSIYINKKG
ncbi:Transcription initiation factor TFIID subunit 1 [Armadillidium nasatum]|uniref:Transcription initiation factor TFIID subunit 1 n=1 Tax=Armadillidium nasatum TaxID=96803 RepID=A0A5N5TM78_9CRUS|nr:Transcription initiation factor TFIID subunit 1 [Armadillidium nasatum]